MTTPYDLLTSPVFLIVATGAAARLTRLVTTDSIFDYPRLWASHWDWSHDLVHCAWCVGFWLSLATAAILPMLWHVAAIRVLAVALAINHVFATLETKD